MSHVIIKPRAVIREALSEPLNLAKFDEGTRAYIATILTKPDEEWTRAEFRKMHTFFGDCDD